MSSGRRRCYGIFTLVREFVLVAVDGLVDHENYRLKSIAHSATNCRTAKTRRLQAGFMYPVVSF